MIKRHKNQKDIPVTLEERKERHEWLLDHSVWNSVSAGSFDRPVPDFTDCVTYEFYYADPETLLTRDETKNTMLVCYIEAGPKYTQSDGREGQTIDLNLGCAGPMGEDLLFELGTLVDCFYTEDGHSKGLKACEGECVVTTSDFCDVCGFNIHKHYFI